MSSPDESKSIVSLKKTKDELLHFDIDMIQAETISSWDKEIQVILSKFNSKTNAVLPLLESYIKSLTVEQSKSKDFKIWEHLITTILTHLALFKSKIDWTHKKYYPYFEDILSIYGTVELNLVGDLFQNKDVQSQKVYDQLKIISGQIITNLKQLFNWKSLNVVHCLLKIKYDKGSPACGLIMKMMCQQILFNNSIRDTDDITLCGYYLLFCKYKRFIPSEKYEDLKRIFLQKFNKKCSFLNNFPLFQKISCLERNHQLDPNCSKGKITIVNNYFKLIKDKENIIKNEYDTFSNKLRIGVKDISRNNSIEYSYKSCEKYYDERSISNNDNQDSEIKGASYHMRNEDYSISKNSDDLFCKTPPRSYEKSKRSRVKEDIQECGDDNLRNSQADERIITFVDTTSIDTATIDDSIHRQDEKTIFLVGSTDETLDLDMLVASNHVQENFDETDASDREVNEQVPEIDSSQIISSQHEDIIEIDHIVDNIKEDIEIVSEEILEHGDEFIDEKQYLHITDNNNDLVNENNSDLESIASLHIKSDYDSESSDIESMDNTSSHENCNQDTEDSLNEINGIPISVRGQTMYILEVETNQTETETIEDNNVNKSFIETDSYPYDEQYSDIDVIEQKPIIEDDFEDSTNDSNILINQLQEYLSISKEAQTRSYENSFAERTNFSCDNSKQGTEEDEVTDSNGKRIYYMGKLPLPEENVYIAADKTNTWHSQSNFHISKRESSFQSYDQFSTVLEDKNNYNIQFGYETPPKDGSIEQDFHTAPHKIICNQEQMQIAGDNGFLTPENEISANMPQLVNKEILLPTEPIGNVISTYDGQILEEQKFVFPSDLRTIPRCNNDSKLDYCGIEPLRECYNEPTFHCGKNIFDRNAKTNRCVRKHKAVTLNGNLVVKKFHCNDKMMGRLTMPPLINDICDNEVSSTTKKVSNTSRSQKIRQKRMSNLHLDMNIEKAFVELNNPQQHILNNICKSYKFHQSHHTSKTIRYNGVELNDPKLFKMKPVVDLSQFAAPFAKRRKYRIHKKARSKNCNHKNRINGIKYNHESLGINTFGKSSETNPLNECEIKTETIDEIDIHVVKDAPNKNYTDDDINLLLQALKPGTETRLPFKKRRMALQEEEVSNEISYPATPMVSIAELEAIQPLTLPVSISPILPSEVPTYVPEMPSRTEDINYNVNIYPSFNVLPYDAYFEMSRQVFPCNINEFQMKDNFVNT